MVNEGEVGDFCPHSETGVIPEETRMTGDESDEWLSRARQLHEAGQHGNALALLKVIRHRTQKLPEEFRAFRAEVNRAIGKP